MPPDTMRQLALFVVAFVALGAGTGIPADLVRAQIVSPPAPPSLGGPVADPDAAPTVTALVGRLSLERYQATIKGLAQFGDRREGTQRNRDAVDWIESQLKRD